MSVITGADLSTGGNGAQGDFTGVGGPGGFATNVGFSAAPFKTSPFPDVLEIPPSLSDGEDAAVLGVGDFVLSSACLDSSTGGGGCAGGGEGGVGSSTGARLAFVPSPHTIESGAQSSSSSSISAHVACLFPCSSVCSLVAK